MRSKLSTEGATLFQNNCNCRMQRHFMRTSKFLCVLSQCRIEHIFRLHRVRHVASAFRTSKIFCAHHRFAAVSNCIFPSVWFDMGTNKSCVAMVNHTQHRTVFWNARRCAELENVHHSVECLTSSRMDV